MTPVKKIILGFIVAILVVVGGVVIGPTMIDWNAYKGDVSEKLKTLTGRDLKILGDVRVTIFPTPAIAIPELVNKKTSDGITSKISKSCFTG